MRSYPSIETVYVRDASTKKLVIGSIREPEVKLISTWHITEKIDGTNIRLIFTENGLDIRGRTDNAQFSVAQIAFLKDVIDTDRALEYLRHPTRPDWNVTIYGEMYGPKIQKDGENYRSDFGFRAFDVLYGNATWGSRSQLVRAALDVGFNIVPTISEMFTLARLPRSKQEMDALLGCSVVARFENEKEIRSEGFVAKPPLPLLNARGERVMFKLTYRDLPEAA